MIVLCVILNCHLNSCGTSAVNGVSHHISSHKILFCFENKLRYFHVSLMPTCFLEFFYI